MSSGTNWTVFSLFLFISSPRSKFSNIQ
jgi:hypothetical protein